MKIFSSNAGTVGVINPTDGNTSPFVMRVDEAELSGDLIRGIVTSMSVSQDTSVQFMHSLRDTIYINVFGNKIGQMNISGILFIFLIYRKNKLNLYIFFICRKSQLIITIYRNTYYKVYL